MRDQRRRRRQRRAGLSLTSRTHSTLRPGRRRARPSRLPRWTPGRVWWTALAPRQPRTRRPERTAAGRVRQPWASVGCDNVAGVIGDQSSERRLDRRTLLRDALAAGGAVAAGGTLGELVAGSGKAFAKAPPAPSLPSPNILVVMVDQLRAPQWFQTGALAGLMPNLAQLRSGGVSFASHYTAANDCSPARGTLLTGLYSHQTGCLVTGGSTLAPLFPTWGTMLREHGYTTAWFGKWHLTSHDNRWTASHNAHALEPYGFSGGTYPSPDGAPGQGWRVDPLIAAQFDAWYAKAPANRPWCTSVSFVNPHDIAWWYRWTAQTTTEKSAPSIVHALPGELRDPDSADREAQAAFAAVVAADRRGRLRPRFLQRPERAQVVAAIHGPLPEAARTGGRPDRSGDGSATETAGARREHGRGVHLRSRRVRLLARPARQGRRSLRGGDQGAPDRQGPARPPECGPSDRAQRTDLERRRRAAAA